MLREIASLQVIECAIVSNRNHPPRGCLQRQHRSSRLGTSITPYTTAATINRLYHVLVGRGQVVDKVFNSGMAPRCVWEVGAPAVIAVRGMHHRIRCHVGDQVNVRQRQRVVPVEHVAVPGGVVGQRSWRPRVRDVGRCRLNTFRLPHALRCT